LPTATPPPGYKFLGWYTAPSGGSPLNIPRSGGTVLQYAKDFTAYAQFAPDTVDVTYDWNYGGFVDGPFTYTINDLYGTQMPSRTRAGFALVAWSNLTANVAVDGLTPVTLASAHTLTAFWRGINTKDIGDDCVVVPDLSTDDNDEDHFVISNGDGEDNNGLPKELEDDDGLYVDGGHLVEVEPGNDISRFEDNGEEEADWTFRVRDYGPRFPWDGGKGGSGRYIFDPSKPGIWIIDDSGDTPKTNAFVNVPSGVIEEFDEEGNVAKILVPDPANDGEYFEFDTDDDKVGWPSDWEDVPAITDIHGTNLVDVGVGTDIGHTGPNGDEGFPFEVPEVPGYPDDEYDYVFCPDGPVVIVIDGDTNVVAIIDVPSGDIEILDDDDKNWYILIKDNFRGGNRYYKFLKQDLTDGLIDTESKYQEELGAEYGDKLVDVRPGIDIGNTDDALDGFPFTVPNVPGFEYESGYDYVFAPDHSVVLVIDDTGKIVVIIDVPTGVITEIDENDEEWFRIPDTSSGDPENKFFRVKKGRGVNYPSPKYGDDLADVGPGTIIDHVPGDDDGYPFEVPDVPGFPWNDPDDNEQDKPNYDYVFDADIPAVVIIDADDPTKTNGFIHVPSGVIEIVDPDDTDDVLYIWVPDPNNKGKFFGFNQKANPKGTWPSKFDDGKVGESDWYGTNMVDVAPGVEIEYCVDRDGYPFTVPSVPGYDPEDYDYVFLPNIPIILVVDENGDVVVTIDVPSGIITIIDEDGEWYLIPDTSSGDPENNFFRVKKDRKVKYPSDYGDDLVDVGPETIIDHLPGGDGYPFEVPDVPGFPWNDPEDVGQDKPNYDYVFDPDIPAVVIIDADTGKTNAFIHVPSGVIEIVDPEDIDDVLYIWVPDPNNKGQYFKFNQKVSPRGEWPGKYDDGKVGTSDYYGTNMVDVTPGVVIEYTDENDEDYPFTVPVVDGFDPEDYDYVFLPNIPVILVVDKDGNVVVEIEVPTYPVVITQNEPGAALADTLYLGVAEQYVGMYYPEDTAETNWDERLVKIELSLDDDVNSTNFFTGYLRPDGGIMLVGELPDWAGENNVWMRVIVDGKAFPFKKVNVLDNAFEVVLNDVIRVGDKNIGKITKGTDDEIGNGTVVNVVIKDDEGNVLFETTGKVDGSGNIILDNAIPSGVESEDEGDRVIVVTVNPGTKHERGVVFEDETIWGPNVGTITNKAGMLYAEYLDDGCDALNGDQILGKYMPAKPIDVNWYLTPPTVSISSGAITLPGGNLQAKLEWDGEDGFDIVVLNHSPRLGRVQSQSWNFDITVAGDATTHRVTSTLYTHPEGELNNNVHSIGAENVTVGVYKAGFYSDRWGVFGHGIWAANNVPNGTPVKIEVLVDEHTSIMVDAKTANRRENVMVISGPFEDFWTISDVVADFIPVGIPTGTNLNAVVHVGGLGTDTVWKYAGTFCVDREKYSIQDYPPIIYTDIVGQFAGTYKPEGFPGLDWTNRTVLVILEKFAYWAHLEQIPGTNLANIVITGAVDEEVARGDAYNLTNVVFISSHDWVDWGLSDENNLNIVIIPGIDGILTNHWGASDPFVMVASLPDFNIDNFTNLIPEDDGLESRGRQMGWFNLRPRHYRQDRNLTNGVQSVEIHYYPGTNYVDGYRFVEDGYLVVEGFIYNDNRVYVKNADLDFTLPPGLYTVVLKAETFHNSDHITPFNPKHIRVLGRDVGEVPYGVITFEEDAVEGVTGDKKIAVYTPHELANTNSLQVVIEVNDFPVGGKLVGPNDDGTWDIVLENALSEGEYRIVITITDGIVDEDNLYAWNDTFVEFDGNPYIVKPREKYSIQDYPPVIYTDIVGQFAGTYKPEGDVEDGWLDRPVLVIFEKFAFWAHLEEIPGTNLANIIITEFVDEEVARGDAYNMTNVVFIGSDSWVTWAQSDEGNWNVLDINTMDDVYANQWGASDPYVIVAKLPDFHITGFENLEPAPAETFTMPGYTEGGGIRVGAQMGWFTLRPQHYRQDRNLTNGLQTVFIHYYPGTDYVEGYRFVENAPYVVQGFIVNNRVFVDEQYFGFYLPPNDYTVVLKAETFHNSDHITPFVPKHYRVLGRDEGRIDMGGIKVADAITEGETDVIVGVVTNLPPGLVEDELKVIIIIDGDTKGPRTGWVDENGMIHIDDTTDLPDGEDIPITIIIKNGKDKVAITDPGTTINIRNPTFSGQIVITSIRVFKATDGVTDMIEIVATGCKNEAKFYNLFGHEEEISKSLGGASLNAEVSVPLRKRGISSDGDVGERVFVFPKPDTDRHFYHVREFGIPATDYKGILLP